MRGARGVLRPETPRRGPCSFKFAVISGHDELRALMDRPLRPKSSICEGQRKIKNRKKMKGKKTMAVWGRKENVLCTHDRTCLESRRSFCLHQRILQGLTVGSLGSYPEKKTSGRDFETIYGGGGGGGVEKETQK